jgi:cysteinyl-tRNA synthetase
MAKRLGNYYTLRDLLAKGLDPLAIRYLLLSTHYRQQFNFTFEGLAAAKSAIERLSTLQRRLRDANGNGNPEKIEQLILNVQSCFSQAMDDDLNVSIALASLFDFVKEINNLVDTNAVSKENASRIVSVIEDLDTVLGVIPKAEEGELPLGAQELIRKREEARKVKDWKMADALRQELRMMGIIIEDTAQGVKWKREKI